METAVSNLFLALWDNLQIDTYAEHNFLQVEVHRRRHGVAHRELECLPANVMIFQQIEVLRVTAITEGPQEGHADTQPIANEEVEAGTDIGGEIPILWSCVVRIELGGTEVILQSEVHALTDNDTDICISGELQSDAVTAHVYKLTGLKGGGVVEEREVRMFACEIVPLELFFLVFLVGGTRLRSEHCHRATQQQRTKD